MIEAKAPLESVFARLTDRAVALAAAHAERRSGERWWRKARLLWPLFTRG